MSMPLQKPGKSRQDYGTPPELLRALKIRLSIDDFSIDLAASAENAVTVPYYTEEDNSLIQPWGQWGWGWAWCNPPFSDIEPWVMKAIAASAPGWNADGTVLQAAKVAMLVPASVGSNWWRECVDGRAHVLFLNGRLTFVGETAPYPKDCAILLYTPFVQGGYEVWNWRHYGKDCTVDTP